MSSIHFIKTELAAALARGVRQSVVVGSRPLFQEAFKSSPDQSFHVFTVEEEHSSVSSGTFVPTQLASEALATALKIRFRQTGSKPVHLARWPRLSHS